MTSKIWPISELDADMIPMGHCPEHGIFWAVSTHWCPRCEPRHSQIIKNNYMVIRTGLSLPVGYIMDSVDIVEASSDVFDKRALMSCEGQELQIDSYPDLFKVLGHTYGGSFENRSFKMPDLKGKLFV